MLSTPETARAVAKLWSGVQFKQAVLRPESPPRVKRARRTYARKLAGKNFQARRKKNTGQKFRPR